MLFESNISLNALEISFSKGSDSNLQTSFIQSNLQLEGFYHILQFQKGIMLF